MAYIVPSDISQLALAGSNATELNTLADLKVNLSDSYTVFHGVHWTRSYKGGTCYGEIDFVIVNRAGQVLVIEQKNGPLNESEQGLTKIYDDGQKNAGDQVRRSLENIRKKFQWQHGKKRRLELDYLIYCPDHKVRMLNAVGVDQNRIVDASKAAELAGTIEGILGDGATEKTDWAMFVEGFFQQSFELVPDIHAHLSAQEKCFSRLSGGLAEIVDNIEMLPFKLRIRGCAGCGKSLVAHRLFNRAIANGKRPLLVCYSRPLRERLNAIVDKGGMVQTWNGFCDEFLKSRGHKIDYDQMKIDPEFWEQIAETVIGETVPEDWLFDSLIVDEGQDFDQTWVEILRLFLKPNADIAWLEDQDQDIYNRQPGPLEGMVGYNCNTNFRSPETIARFIHRVLPFDFENANDLPGLGVGFEGYDQTEDQIKIVAHIVGQLIKQGFNHSDIVILTSHGHNHSVFSKLQKVGNYSLRQFTGDYDIFGNQVLTSGKLRFDSIYRFKGQQAPAVILVDVDPSPEKLEQQLRLLYCGMTRATVKLELVYNRSNDFCSRFWD